MMLGIIQQVALVPVFLHFWGGEELAAWFVIYAIGNLVLVADSGLQLRTINRFFSFKSSVDCDGRTAAFYAAILRLYLWLSVVLVGLVMAAALALSPSTVFRFELIEHFDAAFVAMTAGMLLTLPAGLVSALYRARGLYGRAVWLQSLGTLIGQVAQLVAIVATASLFAVTIAYVAMQILIAAYLITIDAPRLHPFLRKTRVRPSMRWMAGQLRKAAPFGIAGATELALMNLPVLLVSALIADRVAVAQWGLIRVAAGLLRTLCLQVTLPLAAELGHDYAVGATEQLRALYARGSVFVTVLASAVVSGLLPFWPDFFALWTRGAIAYDPLLAKTMLIGTSVAAPAILALSYANYSNRADLLVRSKGLQLIVFLVLSLLMIPQLGPLGAAAAIVASDLLVQFGLLTLVIMRQTLKRPFLHLMFLAGMMVTTMLAGWGLGIVIHSAIPWTGVQRFVAECVVWLAVAGAAATPLLIGSIRARIVAAIPR
jgi:O-antigen/teichoic acid export membrane protein